MENKETPWSFRDIREMMKHRGENAGQLERLGVIENGQFVPDEDEEAEPIPAGKFLMLVAANLGAGVTALGATSVISGWIAFAVLIPCIATICVLKGAA